LQGARQTGKTYIIKAFGRDQYDNTVYCNFEEYPVLDGFFQRDLNPERILTDLSVYYNHEIKPGIDLLIFDEIQASNGALNSLKYFAEKRNDIHIIAAGSLLGVKLSARGSFPVGKVNFLHLFPMTFMEFLDGMGEFRYRQLLDNVSEPIPLSEAFHFHLIDLLRQYYFTGGMPEAVKHFAETGNGPETREIQEEIIKSYIMDFAKHAPAFDIPKLTLIWDSIPKHLAKENKKFIFSAVKKGARAREYENALTWLEDAGLIHQAKAVKSVKHPLKYYADSGCFKVYALDVGLLGAMSKSPVKLLAQGDRLFNEYDRESGGYRIKRPFDLHRFLSGGDLAGLGAGSIWILNFRLLRVRKPRLFMPSQYFSSKAITSGSRRLYSKVTISKVGVVRKRAGSVATRSKNVNASIHALPRYSRRT